MIANRMAVMASLGLASMAGGQQKVDEQRIAVLIETLKHEGQRDDAKVALLRMDGGAAELLVQALRAKPRDISEQELIEWKRTILDVITLTGKDAAHIFDDLGGAISDLPDELGLGAASLVAWGEIGLWASAGSERVGISFLSGALNGAETYEVRSVRFGEERVVTFRGLSPQDRPHVLGRAARRLNAPQAPTLEAVREILEESHPNMLELGADFAAVFGEQTVELLPQLAAVFEDKPLKRRAYGTYGDLVLFKAARTIIAVAPDDPRSAVAYGYLAAHHYDPSVRRESAMTAGHFGEAGRPSLSFLLVALQDNDELVVRDTITALGMIGSAAKDAIPTLERLVEHDDNQIAERAKAALRQIRADGNGSIKSCDSYTVLGTVGELAWLRSRLRCGNLPSQ